MVFRHICKKKTSVLSGLFFAFLLFLHILCVWINDKGAEV